MFRQSQVPKQSQKITSRQIATLDIYQLDTISLEQRIRDEIDENPLLDQVPEEMTMERGSKDTIQDFQSVEENIYDDIPDYKTEYRNYIATEQVPEKVYAEQVDFREELKKQFRIAEADCSTYDNAAFIIDSLNEKGFLEQGLEKISNELSFKYNKWITAEELESVLKKIQTLEPAGAGSRDIKEYFLIQLKSMDSRRPDVKKAISLLEYHFDELGTCSPEKIAAELGLDRDEIQIILRLLSALRKSPVEDIGPAMQLGNNILPDFTIEPEGEELVVSLVNERSSSLFINNSIAEQIPARDKSAMHYIKSKLDSAKWFINCIREREFNMLKIIKAIVSYQRDFFLTGNTLMLKPMILKNISERVGLDISTVSRITANKYAQTPTGNILLKDLFSEGMCDQHGNLVSNRVIREIMVELVNQEDKKAPYNDLQLAKKLFELGYKVARRTVVKYREQSGIPSSKLRAFQA